MKVGIPAWCSFELVDEERIRCIGHRTAPIAPYEELRQIRILCKTPAMHCLKKKEDRDEWHIVVVMCCLVVLPEYHIHHVNQSSKHNGSVSIRHTCPCGSTQSAIEEISVREERGGGQKYIPTVSLMPR